MSRELLAQGLTSHITRAVEFRNTISCVSKQCVRCGGELKRGATKYCGLVCYRIIQRSLPIADRFWPKVNKDGPIHPVLGTRCWPWTGNVFGSTGYGGFGMLRPDGKYAPVGAHRIAWELTHGPIPDGQHCLHHCDLPPCVNPDHLFLGTHRLNMEDASTKGRLSIPRRRTRGFKADAIARYLAGGTTLDAVAAQHGIHKMTVFRWVKAATSGADQRALRHQRAAS